jgi:hypothetical protein
MSSKKQKLWHKSIHQNMNNMNIIAYYTMFYENNLQKCTLQGM